MTTRSGDRASGGGRPSRDAIDVRSVLVDDRGGAEPPAALPPGIGNGGLGPPEDLGAHDERQALHRRRLVLAGLAGSGLVAAPLLAARHLLDDDTQAAHDRDVTDRAVDDGGFANRDESYASTGRGVASDAPLTVYDSASEAAAATEVSAPTILATDDPVVHLLRRVTFGPTPEMVDEVHAQGIDAWLARQLDPGSIPDPTADQVWALHPMASMGPAEIQQSIERHSWDAMAEYARATLSRQIWSRRQVFEVMVDFWANHLNVPTPGPGSWDVGATYHNDVIREHALGTLTDMLLAAMQHPAMLRYLTNDASRKESVNENLGRELLELHTVGVTSGYTEDDVRNSAYILTGRTVWREDQEGADGTFRYDAERHWTGPVRVLGFEHPNPTGEGGMGVGDAYLRYLATHPATARTVARKLAVRLVSDSPPDALVNRLATTYLESGTAIGPVLDLLFRTDVFWASVGRKTRRPLENLVASVRALGVGPGADTYEAMRGLAWRAVTVGHMPLAWKAPDGYPDVHPAWRSAGGILASWNSHRALTGGWHEGLTYTTPSQLLADRPQATVGEYVDSLCQRLCFQTFATPHRDALVAFVEADAAAPTAQSDLRDDDRRLVPLVLHSPYFALR